LVPFFGRMLAANLPYVAVALFGSVAALWWCPAVPQLRGGNGVMVKA
jgi:hypothetical protein